MYLFTPLSILLYCLLLYAGAKKYPDWVIHSPDFDPNYKLSKTTDEKKFIDVVDAEFTHINGTSDGEKVDLVERFFWGMEGGTIIELGALSGDDATDSQSLIFENFGWKRILLEGNPMHKKGLAKHKEAFSANVAICEGGDVHYVNSAKIPMTSGIIEFMEPRFLWQYYREIFDEATRVLGGGRNMNMSDIRWDHLSKYDIKSIKCVTVSEVLNTIGITHVNAFILDVEGAEINILKSINWDKHKFDVLVIEKNHHKAALEFFADKPAYQMVGDRGRNLWYHHIDYTPSIRPGTAKLCYRGCAKIGISGCEKYCL